VKAGHVNGANTHNVSATISIDESRKYPFHEEQGEVWERNEWEEVGIWMWTNRKVYNGLSVLPAFNHTYKQSPFEDITKEEYEKRIETLTNIDLTKVSEIDDNVEFSQIASCAGGACEINL
jgi:hypothetical protein